MSIIKNLKIRFKNNAGDDYETVENTREIPILSKNIDDMNDNSLNSNKSVMDIGNDLSLIENQKVNGLQIHNTNDGKNNSMKNNVSEGNIESGNLEKETKELLSSENIKVLNNEKCFYDNESCISKECSFHPNTIKMINEKSCSPSSITTIDQGSVESNENINKSKVLSTVESSPSTSRCASESSKKLYDNENDKDEFERTYNPDDKDDYRRHIESKMSQLWMLVDDFSKGNTPYIDKKYFDFEDFFKNEKEYKMISSNELTKHVTDAYKQSEDISAHINAKTELSKNYKAEMIVQATYLKDQLYKLEKFTDQQELENETRRNKVEKKLEAFYKKSVEDFKEYKVNITLDEFKEIFDSYHNFRVEKTLHGEISLSDNSNNDRRNKKNSKEYNKENEKGRLKGNSKDVNNISPEEVRNKNIEFIRQITGRYSHSTIQPKIKKEKSLLQKLPNKAQNISQLQFVERKCNYTLENCPELIRDISRIDYNDNGFKGRLDIETLCQEMRNYLLTHTISRYHFSQKVLGMSGGALNELLNKPRIFEELTEKGITSFLKIRVYLDIVKSKGPYEGKKLSQENIILIKKLNKYYQGV
uniref:CUT domain-containing protein n=1 Tax=Strongyloides stercoralis TaxID=6248 RepID=A0A0K0DYG5_STRER